MKLFKGEVQKDREAALRVLNVMRRAHSDDSNYTETPELFAVEGYLWAITGNMEVALDCARAYSDSMAAFVKLAIELDRAIDDC